MIAPLFGPSPAAEPPLERSIEAPAPDTPASRADIPEHRAPSAPVEAPAVRTVEPMSSLPTDRAPSMERQASHELPPDRETTTVRVVLQPAASFPEPAVPSADTARVHAPPLAAPLVREGTAPVSPAGPPSPKRRPASIEAGPALRPSLESVASRGASTDDGPVVVVNIGRIEVRATPPPAPVAPPRARRPAAVSLEEYLRPKRRGR